MAANSFLEQGVDLEKLAAITKNFSGAEIEGLVKDAVAYALNRNVDFNDLHKPLDEDNIKVRRGVIWARGMCTHTHTHTHTLTLSYSLAGYSIGLHEGL
jgi:hypothetical protein